MRLRRVARRLLLGLVLLAMFAGGTLYLLARDAIGARAEGARRARVESSPQWGGDGFTNRLPRIDGPPTRILREFFFGGSEFRSPSSPIVPVARRGAEYAPGPASGLRVTWLGHSTLLLEIDGQRVLIDPVWGERTSPLPFLGPKRFFTPPLPLAELPTVDVVVISHDHYDHLDTPTIRALAASASRFLVPLGVGAHLEKWGIASSRITELDWWEQERVGGLTLTATPARHFSGRGLTDARQTLWTGWAIVGPQHRVFYSGDTAFDEFFTEIGTRLGPFDLTMIEAGAYDAMWADVHLGPEQAVLAHQLVRGNLLLPVHWGLFDLALHGWTEPIERVLVAAERAGVRVASPRPGEWIEPARFMGSPRWWPSVPWRTVEESPVYSSGVTKR